MSILAYTGARLGVFFALFGVLWLAGAAPWFAAALALVLAWALSYVLFRPLYQAAAEQMSGLMQRAVVTASADDAIEDAEVDGLA